MVSIVRKHSHSSYSSHHQDNDDKMKKSRDQTLSTFGKLIGMVAFVVLSALVLGLGSVFHVTSSSSSSYSSWSFFAAKNAPTTTDAATKTVTSSSSSSSSSSGTGGGSGIFSAASRRRLFKQGAVKVFVTVSSSNDDGDDDDPIARKLLQDLKFAMEDDQIELDVYATTLQEQQSFVETSCGDKALARFGELLLRQQEHLASEVYKYCALKENGGVYLDSSSPLLVRLQDVLAEATARGGGGSGISPRSVAVLSEEYFFQTIHGSLLILQPNQKHIAADMLDVLLDTSLDTLEFHQLFLPRTLYELISNDVASNNGNQHRLEMGYNNNGPNWTLFETKCHVDPLRRDENGSGTDGWSDSSSSNSNNSFRYSHACPEKAGFCCTVQDGIKTVMISKHPILPFQKVSNSLPTPYNAEAGHYDEAELPYISTIKEVVYERPAVEPKTPNFFDVLLANNCLPDDVNCSKCLRDKNGADCKKCAAPCGCYCETLCKEKPIAKFVAKDITISPPLYSRDPNRLVPRIIHQTYFEELTQEKYPNMSRLVESFKTSGWEYKFYTDEAAQNFLSTHFPTEVRQAYDALRPGAFKADLFRYCALLIHGGLYVDVDIMLESALDFSIPPDVGFETPMDEPGVGVNRRFCVWNGLIASAPGHPFLAKAIETVVNQVRNRFTSVDVDARFCGPAHTHQEMSILHSFDMLFTAGPCLLGSAINFSLGRDGQQRFVPGELVAKDGDELDALDKATSFVIGTDDENPRLRIPGRSIILHQEKWDMGSHRFTFVEKNLVVAATDLEDSDDRKNNQEKDGKKTTPEHYSKTHAATGIYGLQGLYTEGKSANEDVRFLVDLSMQTKIKNGGGGGRAATSSLVA